RVVALDEPCGLGVGERPALDRGAAVAGDLGLDDLEDLGAGRGSARRLDLETVVGPRVVAGGDDDARRGAALDDLVARHLGRHGAGRVGDGNVVGEEDLRGRGREELRGETPVVGEYDAFGFLAAVDDVAGDAVVAAPDVLERVVVGDLGPPPVGAEDDRRRGRGFGDVRHARTSWLATRSRSALTSAWRWRAPARCAQTLSATIVPPVGASTASVPSTGRTSRSSGPTSTVSPDCTTRPAAPRPSPPLRPPSRADQLPRSLQPASIAAIRTRWSAAAPSITAWSIEIGVIRS